MQTHGRNAPNAPSEQAGTGDEDDILGHETARQIDLKRCVPALLTATANRVSHGTSTTYRKYAGIGFVEWRIICFLAAEGCASGVDLASGLGLDKAAISRNLRSLAQAGLVETRAAHGRRTESALTPTGMALRAKVLQLALAREENMLRGLDADDREKLISMLNIISCNLLDMDGAQ